MTRHTESIEVVVKDQRRRRWSLAEKARWCAEPTNQA